MLLLVAVEKKKSIAKCWLVKYMNLTFSVYLNRKDCFKTKYLLFEI